MFRRIITLALVALFVIMAAGCNGKNSNNDQYGGTDDWIQRIWFGDTPIQASKTSNVPLAHTSKIRFEVVKPVSEDSLNLDFDLRIVLQNLDTGAFVFVDENVMKQNGELVWLGDDHKTMEYRLFHSMNYFDYYGKKIDLGDPGNTFTVRIDYLVGQSINGHGFAFYGDEFRIVWSQSDVGLDDTDDDDLFGGSSPILSRLFIGDVTAESGKTVNVPLSNTDRIRFELVDPVSETSLSQLFTFLITVENLDGDQSFNLTQNVLSENGELVWIGSDNRTIEFRLNHMMDHIVSGGQNYILGQPGDRFRIKVSSLQGAKQDGTTFNFQGDEFFVVWTDNTSGLVN